MALSTCVPQVGTDVVWRQALILHSVRSANGRREYSSEKLGPWVLSTQQFGYDGHVRGEVMLLASVPVNLTPFTGCI